MQTTLEGIIPPLITPLLDSGTLDEEGFEKLIERVLAGGVNGLFLLGTTGESPSVTIGLKSRLTRLACKLAAGRAPILVNVTATAVEEVLELAASAADLGASALVLAPPFYFPLTQEELAGYFERIIPRLPLPVYLYNYPQLFKVPIGLETLQRVRQLPNILGLKDSSGDMDYLGSVRRLFPRGSGFGLYCGPEELLVEALHLGADGGVSGGANLYPALYVDLFKAQRRGDSSTVAVLQEMVLEVSRNIYAVAGGYAGTLRGIKCALAALGVSNGSTAEPLVRLPEELAARIGASARLFEERLMARAK